MAPWNLFLKFLFLEEMFLQHLKFLTFFLKLKILKQHFSKIIKHKKLHSIIETSIEKESKIHHVFEQEIAIKRQKKRFFLI